MPRHSYREYDYTFGQTMMKLRTSMGLSQAGLADLLGVSRRTVGEWEAGGNYPRAEHLQHFLALCVQQHVFTPGREEEEIRALWRVAHQKVLLDESWLHEQFGRLSALEQSMFSWLAILREPVNLEELLAVLRTPRAPRQVLEALDWLYRRSLIESGQRVGSFTLQSVVLEYATAHLIEEASNEIESGKLVHLIEHCLGLAGAPEYVRQAQQRLIVAPLLMQVRSVYSQRVGLEKRLLALLDQVRSWADDMQGYGPANVMALLRELRGDLRGLDLSRLSIRGAYLQGVQMQDTTLAGSHLHETAWTSPFNAILSIAVSPDGRFWAAGSNRGEVRVWREEGRIAHLTLRAQTDRISGIAFSPDGRTLITASWNGRIEFWDPASGAAIGAQREHEMAVTSIVYRPDGRQFASSSYDGTVRIWNARDGTCLQILRAYSGPVLTLSWSPDGRVLASAGFDQMIRLWEVKTGTCIRTFIGHTGAVSAVAWSPGGQMVASCGYDTTIRLWNLESEQCRSVLWGHTGLVLSLAFTPDGKRLLSGSHDQTLRVWESESGRCVHILQGYAISLFAVAWRPDGHALVDGSSDAVLSLWNPQDHTPVQTLRGHTQCINDVAWSPSGGLLASSSDDQTVRLWDTRTGTCLRILRGYTNLVNGIAWHPGGNLLASSSEDHSVLIWQAERGEVLLRLEGHKGPVYDVAWSTDGSRLASCGGSGRRGELLVWDAVEGDRVTSPGKSVLAPEADMSPVFSLAWSLDGTLLMSGGTDGRLYWWEIDRETSPIGVPAHEGWIHSIQVSPDGGTVASSGEDGAIQLWNRTRQKRWA